jgi:Fe-S-cluster-containing dehydrogenase component/CRP-like cAMP-binding protein
MADTEVAARRPERWDAPLDAAMRLEDVDRLLAVEPFRSIDPRSFPPSLPLRDILKNDARIVRYPAGAAIVREGDYGSSAFLILRGRVRVVFKGLTPESLGREPSQKLSWWATLRRVLFRSSGVEQRDRTALPRSADRRPRDAPAEPADPAPPSPYGPHERRGAGIPQPRVFVQDVPRVLDLSDAMVLEAGELFGELAAITRSPRAATVIAEGEAVLVEIRWQGLRDLMRRTDALRQHIEQLYRENSLRTHLRETPLLADLPPDQLAAIAEATVFESHGEFDWHSAYEAAVLRRPGDAIVDEPLIAEEGVPATGLILIRSGFARQSQRYGHGHRTVAYLGRGKVFGLAEAIESAATGRLAPWSFSLRALGYVDVLRIPQEAIERHVIPYLTPEVLEELVGQRRSSAPPWDAAANATQQIGAAAPPKLDQGLLEFLVDRRLFNGQEAMVIDLDRCTRCDDCVRACAATHDNNPRFVRQGPRHENIMVAHACMHCVDPVCMIGCPTGAIGRDADTGVVRINDRTCIGCGLCAASCPYDNIQMVEIRDRRGAVLTDAATHQPLAKATKCDLCTSLPGGPACQRACPHDALVRLDLGNLGDLAAWLNR